MPSVAIRSGSHRRRASRRRVAVALVLVVLAVPVAAVGAKALQYRLDRIGIIYEGRVDVAPIATALPGGEAIAYQTNDGLRLTGWYLAAPGATSVAVLFHGTGASRATMAPLAERLSAAHIAVFLAEYRGAADSPGTPSEKGLARDAEAALAEAESLTGTKDRDVIVVGHSLGTAVSVGLANRHRFRGVVLIAPFTTLLDVTGVGTHRLFAWIAAGADRFDLVGTIGGIHAPLVVLRTEGDQIVPNAQSVGVFNAARDPKREVVVTTGYAHADPRFVDGPESAAAVVSLAAG